MLTLKKLVLLNLSLFIVSTVVYSQNELRVQTSGYVNFNLGRSTLSDTNTQTISLFGCNTVLADTSDLWYGPTNGFAWDSTNQMLSNLPHGYKTDPVTGGTYYVSKYYIASPPVFHKNKAGGIDSNTIYDIGIITPDEFVFHGNKPVQRVFLDYNILERTQIEYIPVVFDASFQKLADSLQHKINVNYVPFTVECADFPWIDTAGMIGGEGASGIGSFLRDSTDTAMLFLPYRVLTKEHPNKDFVNCKVTILNDILLHYEVFFVVGSDTTQTLDLRDHVLNQAHEPISFHCAYREELPCGCKKPEFVDPYGEE